MIKPKGGKYMPNNDTTSYKNEFDTHEMIDIGSVECYLRENWTYVELRMSGRTVELTSSITNYNLKTYLRGYINFGIDESGNDLEMYNFGGIRLRLLSEEQIIILSNHIKNINKEARQLLNRYDEKFTSIMKLTTNQNILHPIVDGFIDHFLSDKYQTVEVFSEIERSLVLTSKELEWFLQVNNIQRMRCSNNLAGSMREFVDNGGNYEEFNSVETKVEKAYSQLTKLIQSKIQQEYIFSKYFTYKLLWCRILIRRAKKWEQICGNYFIDTEKSLDSYIVQFKKINEIDQNNSIYIESFVFYLIYNNILSSKDSFFDNVLKVEKIIAQNNYLNDLESFENLLNQPIAEEIVTLAEIDLMTGYEFEEFVSILFSKMGFSTKITKSSGDQGIDIIAEKNNTSFGIQAKRYTGSVGNSSVQETVAGLNHYGLKKGIVLTTSYFTKSAIQLADSNDIILWDRDKLTELVQTYFK